MRILRRLSISMAAVVAVTGVAAAPVAAGPPVTPGQTGTKGALAWGSNDDGRLGDGSLIPHATAVEPFGLHAGVRQISAGTKHTVAILDGGGVLAWGDNTEGQLGDGTVETHLIPVAVKGLGRVVRVSAGGAHTLALAADGTVWAWGDNGQGQLGEGTLVDRLTPVRVVGLTNVVRISAGERFSLALRSDATVWAWGDNAAGQLGLGSTADTAVPFLVPGLPAIAEISAGHSHSLALQPSGIAWAWGNNQAGQLGDGTIVGRATPAPVPVLSGMTGIAAGASFSVFLINGQAHQWGESVFCDVGDDQIVCPPLRQARFTTIPLRDVVAISAGGEGVAIRSDRTVWQWDAALGAIATPHLIQIENVGGAVQIDAGLLHAAVLVDRPPVLQP